jgi:hypothetical protein
MNLIPSLLATRRARMVAAVFAAVVLIGGFISVRALMVANQPNAPTDQSEASSQSTPGGNQAAPGAAGQSKTDTPAAAQPGKTTTAQLGASGAGSAAQGQSSSGSSGTGSSTSGSGGNSSGSSTPSQSCAAYPSFPDASCTGVPSGVTLSSYGGPCTITTNGTVIEAKTVNCDLSIQASNVVIRNSIVNGSVATPESSLAYSFSITDSEVRYGIATALFGTVVGEANFSLLRVEVTGGNRSVYCRKNCTVKDSWIHSQNIPDTPRIHASAIRQSQGATIVHNRIHCSVEDTSSGGGCSANLTGYGDFEPVQNNTIEKNLFMATPAGACAYGGSSGDDGSKPYGHLAQNIVFKDNVFQRGNSSGKCGWYFPITDFDDTRPGNVWTNNTWDDGSVLPSAN